MREARLQVVGTGEDVDHARFARDVAAGLGASPKQLACRGLYDAVGSRLFDEICAIPEYYLTRAEGEILADHAPAIAACLAPDAELVELGSGSAIKTRLLISAFLAKQGYLLYVPVNISRSALESSARGLLADYPRLRIRGVVAEYEDGLAELAKVRDRPRLILWLGSNVGNFTRTEAAAFLARVRAGMAGHDRLLLGADLRKEKHVLELAYDDPGGVTARFSKNLLARINRELGGRFDLDSFRHRAVYHEEAGHVEINLVSRRAQEIRVEALDRSFRFADGEAIHTEDSFKYSPAEIGELAAAAGLRVEARWLDRAGRFSESLLAPV